MRQIKKTILNRKLKGVAVSDMVSVAVVVTAFLMLAVALAGGFVWNINETTDIYNRYFTTRVDKEVQAIKQGFIKSATFMSLNTVAKELAEHGGYSAATTKDNDGNNFADRVESGETGPSLEVYDGIPFWTIPNCGDILKRVPYLKDSNVNYRAGDILIILLYNDDESAQYIEEVSEGKYPLYVSFELFMLKPGSVTVECLADEGCLAMEPTGDTPDIINYDGIYTYKVTSVDKKRPAVALHVTGADTTGEIDNVVRIKQVVVSIRDPADIDTPNELLTQELGKYYDSMEDELDRQNSENAIQLSVAPLQGVMTKGYQGYVEGTVWPDEDGGSITGSIDDQFFSESGYKLVDIRDSGLVTEETKLRYYLMYAGAKKFTDTSKDLLGNRLWKALNTLEDSADVVREEICQQSGGDMCSPPVSNCPADTVPNYRGSAFEDAIESELDTLGNSLSAESYGFTWTLELSGFSTKGTEYDINYECETNEGTLATSAVDHCISQNLESYEYKKGEFISQGECCGCSASLKDNCGPYSKKHGRDDTSDCEDPQYNDCYMHYRHRYVLKDLKIKVTVTDTQYLYYNTDDNTWDEMSFTFYVTSPLVDDNCCNGIRCDDEERRDVCSNPFELPDLEIIAATEYDSISGSSVIDAGTSETSSGEEGGDDSSSDTEINTDIGYIPGF